MTRIEIEGRTDVGRSRSRNEDFWTADEARGVIAVADGMGGHPAGDVASRLAVQSALEALGAGGEGPDAATPSREPPDPGARMAEAVRAANRRILEEGAENPGRRGMGTTLTLLLLDAEAERYRIGHVGDSRGYLFRDGALEPLTRDHTPLQREVDAGRLTREQARVHPMGHVLSQALGVSAEVEPQIADGPLHGGDLFLLCTDGLTAVLSEERIRELLREETDGPLSSLPDRLVEETLRGGAPDNVTVALARVTAVEA